jgi:two-component system OmpR family response regulator
VLLVDDEPDVRASTSTLLRTLGYRVTTVAASKDARRQLCAEGASFDVVLTDLTMPEEDGTELCSWLRCHHRSLPVVMMTGFLQPELRDRLPQVGVDEVLLKPFNSRQLADALEKVLAGRPAGGPTP